MATKISSILIGVVLIGLFMTGIGMFLTGMSDNYHPIVEDDTINFSKYSQRSTELTEYLITNEDSVKSQTENVSSRGQEVDFFEGGYKVFMSIPRSFGLLSDVTSDTLDGIDAGGDGTTGFGGILKGALITIIFIIIFISVIWAVLVRREEL